MQRWAKVDPRWGFFILSSSSFTVRRTIIISASSSKSTSSISDSSEEDESSNKNCALGLSDKLDEFIYKEREFISLIRVKNLARRKEAMGFYL
jgi:hypothetical protein